MCGIIGYTGRRDAVEIIVDGLKRLEYRGYDSAGVACLVGNEFEVTRCKGKIKELENALAGRKHESHTGIGHTRWATHGKPSVENAHPHRSDGIVLVHNGIIENFYALKQELIAQGYRFASETDTEVLAHLLSRHSKGVPLEEAVRLTVAHVRGAYALAVMSLAEPGKVVALRKDSPLVAGIGNGEYFVASDIPAFLNHSRDVVFLEDNEMAVMTPEGVVFEDVSGRKLGKTPSTISWNTSMAEKGGHKHFMLKEIYEQPRALADTLSGRIVADNSDINIEEFGLTADALKSINKIMIVACGTSWHAGLTGKYLIEEIARVPVEVDIASEYRYRNPILESGTLFVTITQSGETADTLAAQRLAKQMGASTLNICNVVGSTSSREADAVFYTRSGPEIGVASTKAFTTQIAALYLLAIALGRAKDELSTDASRALIDRIVEIPDKIEKTLAAEAEIEKIAKEFHNRQAFLFLGRGIAFPIALEGALKLKEISYIHAEGYPAGEMKHGPIALIDDGYPSVFLVQRGELFEKLISNLQEIKARGGFIILIAEEGLAISPGLADAVITVPSAHPLAMPMLLPVPLQLLAYHIGVHRGCDVDQPRNLAKSVTVE